MVERRRGELLLDERHEPFARKHERLVADEQRAIGGKRLDQPFGRRPLQGGVERQHARVDFRVDAVAEFDGERGLAGVEKARRVIARHLNAP